MEAESLGSILSVVPRGFQAYARVFHPVERDRPRDTKTWQGVDERTRFDGIADIGAALETEMTTWANAAASFGTAMHSEAQYARLLPRDDGTASAAIAPDGWRYAPPSEGCIDAASLSALAAVLARHTRTADAGIAAIWEGWGGLVSSAGVARLSFEVSEGKLQRFADENGGGAGDPEPGSGLLAREVATGMRFDLHGNTGRHYVLFEVGANDLADSAWPERAPWVDQPVWAQSPSIVWPEDHSWVLATEIDFDSTLIAGTMELIQELVLTPGLEALSIRTDADLTSEGDRLNRNK
jgi:hypothetical protein